MISIGGAIGTGLFMGAGRAISITRPSVILAYLIIGIMLFFVLRPMGELLLSSQKFTPFTDSSAGLLRSWADFFMGWTYRFCWIITCIAEMTAITRYVQFWWAIWPAWTIALACVALFVLLNIMPCIGFFY